MNIAACRQGLLLVALVHLFVLIAGLRLQVSSIVVVPSDGMSAAIMLPYMSRRVLRWDDMASMRLTQSAADVAYLPARGATRKVWLGVMMMLNPSFSCRRHNQLGKCSCVGCARLYRWLLAWTIPAHTAAHSSCHTSPVRCGQVAMRCGCLNIMLLDCLGVPWAELSAPVRLSGLCKSACLSGPDVCARAASVPQA